MDLRTRNYWTAQEDDILRREASLQCDAVGTVKNWNEIATKLPGRTNKDCRKRWSKVGMNVKKGHWSADEDDRLRAAVKEHGYSWTVVAQKVITRHADQCAKRWYHFLDPSLSREEWNKDEDDRLLEAVRTYGRSWKLLSEKAFPGRSATDIKNRYIIAHKKHGNSPDYSRHNSFTPEKEHSLGDYRQYDLGCEMLLDPEFLDHHGTGIDYVQAGSSAAIHIAGDTSATTADNNAPTGTSTTWLTESHLALASSSAIADLDLVASHPTSSSLSSTLQTPATAGDPFADFSLDYFSSHNDGMGTNAAYKGDGVTNSANAMQFSELSSRHAVIPSSSSDEENVMQDLAALTDIIGNGNAINNTSQNMYTVVLEDVRPEMLESIMKYVVFSKERVKIKIVSAEDQT